MSVYEQGSAARLELSTRVISHTQVDHLSNVIGNPEKGRHLLLVREMEGRPRRAEGAGAQRRHQRPRRRQNAPIPGGLPKGSRILKPTLDAWDDVHGHFTHVVSEVSGGVLYVLRALLVYGQPWFPSAR